MFFDFFHEKTKKMWTEGLQKLYEKVPFDGVWLDMNEPSGKCAGECPDGLPDSSLGSHQISEEERTNHSWWTSWTNQDEDSTYKLPFNPGIINLDH